jgi:hypothetical protein
MAVPVAAVMRAAPVAVTIAATLNCSRAVMPFEWFFAFRAAPEMADRQAIHAEC